MREATKKLCHGCLKPIFKTHSAGKYNQYRSGKISNKRHPKSVHGFSKKSLTNHTAVSDKLDQNCASKDGVSKSNIIIYDENIACTSTKISTKRISMCVVPVLIKHKDSPKETITGTMLD